MDVVKQIVDNQVVNLTNKHPEFFSDLNDDEKKKSKAFLMISVASYLDIDTSDVLQYLTDGGHDGGFDAAYIAVASDSQLNVILFQTKYTRDLDKDSNFPENAIEKAVNTVKGIFDPGRQMQLNEASNAIVNEIHSYLLEGYIPFVTFVCINNGLEWNSSAQEMIDNDFKNQKQVEFEYFNHKNIIERSQSSKSIDTSIYLNGKAVREDFNYKSVILGRASVNEIYRLMEKYGDHLLEKNIRKYLGRNIVNEGIRNTLLNNEQRNNFFFYNNGVTIVCKKFGANFLQEKDWIVKTENMQIINGGQTCKTIYQTLKDNSDIDFTNAEVLVRIYEVNDDERVIQEITFATNSQNPVDFRDLKSNADEQLFLEQGAAELHYSYKRKRDNQSASGDGDIIPSSVAAEAVLAIWRDRPHLAKYKKYDFFNTYYDLIFKNLNAAQMIIAVLIFRYCDNNRRKASGNPEVQSQRKYSQYFISMLIGRQLLILANLTLDQLTHRTFEHVHELFEENKDVLYDVCEKYIVERLKERLARYGSLTEIDGRTIAAVFRRPDMVEEDLKTGENLLNP